MKISARVLFKPSSLLVFCCFDELFYNVGRGRFLFFVRKVAVFIEGLKSFAKGELVWNDMNADIAEP